MSKIRKIKALIKKCIEKGVQLFIIVRNPHSNGEGFSISKVSFILNKKANIIIIPLKITEMIIKLYNKIIYLNKALFMRFTVNEKNCSQYSVIIV